MPSRKINTRGKKLSLNLDKSPSEPVASEPVASEPVSEFTTTDHANPIATATDVTLTPHPVSEPVTSEPVTDVTSEPVSEPTSEPSEPVTSEPVATPSEPSNRSKLQAEFDERRVAAISSSLELYDGPSLAVHRSDKQPADAPYLSRVAKPVQIAKNIKPRDDANLLACYDHLTTYYGGDYSAGFNPARFGADLGAISRNASLNRLGLTPDGQHVVLTPLGLANARNLAASRAKRNNG